MFSNCVAISYSCRQRQQAAGPCQILTDWSHHKQSGNVGRHQPQLGSKSIIVQHNSHVAVDIVDISNTVDQQIQSSLLAHLWQYSGTKAFNISADRYLVCLTHQYCRHLFVFKWAEWTERWTLGIWIFFSSHWRLLGLDHAVSGESHFEINLGLTYNKLLVWWCWYRVSGGLSSGYHSSHLLADYSQDRKTIWETRNVRALHNRESIPHLETP